MTERRCGFSRTPQPRRTIRGCSTHSTPRGSPLRAVPGGTRAAAGDRDRLTPEEPRPFVERGEDDRRADYRASTVPAPISHRRPRTCLDHRRDNGDHQGGHRDGRDDVCDGRNGSLQDPAAIGWSGVRRRSIRNRLGPVTRTRRWNLRCNLRSGTHGIPPPIVKPNSATSIGRRRIPTSTRDRCPRAIPRRQKTPAGKLDEAHPITRQPVRPDLRRWHEACGGIPGGYGGTQGCGKHGCPFQ